MKSCRLIPLLCVPAGLVVVLAFTLTSTQAATKTWDGRVIDLVGNAQPGVMSCWSLTLTPATCADGGDICSPCNGPFFGSVTTSVPVTTVTVVNPTPTDCATPFIEVFFPTPGRSDIFTFPNGGAAPVCVTATLVAPCASPTDARYSASFNGARPPAFCGIAGYSGHVTRAQPASYAFRVPGNGLFAVWASGLGNAMCANYTLRVDGFDCAVPLGIEKLAPGFVEVC